MQADTSFQSLFERYNLAVKAAKFGIWEYDYLSQEFYWDETMEQLFGCKIETPEQFDNVWLRLVSPQDFKGLTSAFTQARKTGADFHYIFRVNVGSMVKYIESFATFKFNQATQRADKVTGLSFDITEKKLSAIALAEREEYYRMLADNAMDIIVLHQPNGQINYLSPSAIKVLGVTMQDAQEKGGLYFVHPEDIHLVIEHNKASVAGKNISKPYNCRLKNSNGDWITFEIVNKAVRGNNDEVIGILSAMRDVTARKKAEENYRLLAENVTDIVALLSPDGKFEYVSPSVEKLLGFKQADLIGYTPAADVHPDDLGPLLENTIAKNLQGLDGYYSGYRVKHADGHWVYFEIASKPVFDKSGQITHIIKSSRDITERVLAEKAHNQSEQQYKLLADNIADLVVLLSADLKRQYVSPSCQALTGYTPEEFIQLTPGDTVHKEDFAYLAESIANNLQQANDEKITLCYRVVHKNGDTIWVESTIKAIRDDKGQLTNILSTSRDITRQREAEMALQASEEKYRMLADNMSDLLVLSTTDLKRLYVSPSALPLTGYSAEELLQQPALSLIHPDDRERTIHTVIENAAKGINNFSYNCRALRRNGDVLHIASNVTLIRNEENEVENILYTIRDITEEATAKKALAESEEKYRMLADNMSDMITLTGADFSRIYVSPSCIQLTGYTAEELIGQPAISLMHPDDIEMVRDTVQYNIIRGINTFTCNYRGHHKSGRLGYVSSVITVIYNENGGIKHLLSVTRDITNETLAQAALADSEEKYRMLADNMSDMLILIGPDLKRQYVSPSAYQLTGYTPEELIGDNGFSIIYEEDREKLERETLEHIQNGDKSFITTYRGVHKSGKVVHASSLVTILREADGSFKGILTTARDITTEKEAQLALAASEEKYRLLADNMSDLVILHAADLTKLYISPSCKQFTGYTQEEALLLAPGELVFTEDRERFEQEAMESISAGRNNFIINHRGARKDGSWRYMSSYFSIIRDDAGAIKNYLVTVRDVHAETIAKNALTESEERYRMLADNIFDMLILLTPQLKRLYVSPSALQLTGYTAEELMRDENPLSTVYKEDFDYVYNRVTGNIKANVDRFVCKYRLMHKNGQLLYVSSQATILRDVTGNVKNIIITTRDITPEKTAQMLLTDSEEKYRSLVEASENIILMMDESGKYLFANAVACKYMHKEFDEVVGKTIYNFFDRATGDFYVEKIALVLKTKQATTFDYNIKMPGVAVWLRNTLHPIFDSTGSAYAVMLSLVDFTEIKTYTEKLRLQNEELKQIAHLQSHIVRAPLANMEGILNLMNENDMSDENRTLMRLLKKSAMQLDGIVTDIVTKAIDVRNTTQA